MRTASCLHPCPEAGLLADGYRRAKALVEAHPQNVDAHFSMSYVLRYAGLLKDAARLCEQALVLDARTQTSGLRTCARAFIQLGDYSRALNYLHLDFGSGVVKGMSIDMFVRQGRTADALRVGSPHLPRWASYKMVLACVARRQPEEIRELARRVRPAEDPETNYLFASHLAYCGETDPALRLLRRAIEGKYCSYPALESDPLFTTIRTHPSFPTLVAAGRECQQQLLSATKSAQRYR